MSFFLVFASNLSSYQKKLNFASWRLKIEIAQNFLGLISKKFLVLTMVENRKKHRKNSHLIIHCPTSEGVSEVSERASE